MTRRSFLLAAIGVATMLQTAPSKAIAATASLSRSIKVGSNTYTILSGIVEGTRPIASVTCTAKNKVKPRSFAVRASLKTHLHQVVASSGLVYNSTQGVSASVTHARPLMSYYSQGSLVVGGQTYSAKATPTCYGMSAPYCVNTNGQTYGNLPDSENDEIPELISTVGTNGRSGYVYFTAFNAAESGATIPVFAEDGQTVIDQFCFESE